jgi:hypothetical protein
MSNNLTSSTGNRWLIIVGILVIVVVLTSLVVYSGGGIGSGAGGY